MGGLYVVAGSDGRYYGGDGPDDEPAWERAIEQALVYRTRGIADLVARDLSGDRFSPAETSAPTEESVR